MSDSLSVFICLDADRVGAAIEAALLRQDISTAQAIHERVQAAIGKLREQCKTLDGVTLLFSGCDDLLLQLNSNVDAESITESLRRTFRAACGFTMSAGIASSMTGAVVNLRLAKLDGRDRCIAR